MAFDAGSAVGYLLLDISGWSKGLSAAKDAFNTFTDDTATGMDKLSALSTGLTSVGGAMTKTVTAPLVGIGAAVTKTAATFEQGMAQVQATMGITSDAMSTLDGQTVNTMDALSSLAKEMGATTKFSATEAAVAINNMAMAGYDVQEIYSTLPEVLNLASAGALDLDYATQLVANGLNVMGLGTESAAEMADKLAVTASNAYGSVSDFGEGLLIAGAQASLANVNLTNTMTALGILGDAGIAASEGGTYLRNTLKNLYTPTTDAAKALDELGVMTQRADGSVVDFQDVLRTLGQSLDGLSEGDRLTYMSRIFDTRTISAANALIEQSGDRWNELAEKIDNAGGAAEQMAETQLNTLEGKMTIFKSALEGLSISLGEVLIPFLTDLVEKFTVVLDWLNNLDDGTKKMIVTIGVALAALGPIMIIIGNILKMIQTAITVIKTVKTAVTALNVVLAANPIGIVVTAIAALVAAFAYLWNNCEDFREFWINLWESIKEAFSAVVEWLSNGIEAIGKWFAELPNKIEEIIQAIIDWFEQLPEAIRGAIDSALSAITEWASSVYESITTGVSNAINTVVEWFSTLPEKIAYALGYALGSVVSWTEEMVDFITTEVPKIVDSIVNFFAGLPSRIYDWLVEALNSVVSWFSQVWEAVSAWLSDILTTITDWFVSLPGKVADWLSSVIQAVSDWGSDMIESVSQTMTDFVQSIVDWLSGIPDAFMEWFQQVLDFLGSLPEKMFEIGADILNSLWEGLKSVVTGLFDWIGGIVDKIKSIFSSAKEGYEEATKSAQKVSGSYATGLDYVPRDMNVRVHEGERILTKQENKNYDGANSSGRYPEEVKLDITIPLDGQAVAHGLYRYNLREGTLEGDDLVEGSVGI